MIVQAAPRCIYDVRQLNSSYRSTSLPVLEEGKHEQATAQVQYALKDGSHIRQSVTPLLLCS
ncbi:hypothetical protein [Chryseobacterium sp. UNC8MFCol]|uniref:hypothetical protein n=1 Tax=Chryseobacterium sp. UNC8MFCol TaxID=1340435 RepID=UPI0012DE80EA|nr:hypothetical protein [Chryseobacterium sp. UNC8MFCol]